MKFILMCLCLFFFNDLLINTIEYIIYFYKNLINKNVKKCLINLSKSFKKYIYKIYYIFFI